MKPPFVRNLLFAQIETLFEAVHASAGIYQLLLAGAERMALVANLDVLPQAQVITASSYFGWMPSFTCIHLFLVYDIGGHA